jgi:predicted transcriptional regulator
MLTDFGKMLKKLMVDEDISQGQLAKELDISPAILSNYMTGKNVPEMKVVEKCVRQFLLKKGDVKDIFSKAFSSAAKENHKIILDTQYFREDRIDLLVQAITVLLLSTPSLFFTNGSLSIDLEKDIKWFYIGLENHRIEFKPE